MAVIELKWPCSQEVADLANPINKLFVYGTLINPQKQREIIGCRCPSTKACLKDYERRDGKWPYIVPKIGSEVTGLLLKSLEKCDFDKLDAYEDVKLQMIKGRRRILYTRERKEVLTAAGVYVSSWIYLPHLADWPPDWI